MSLDSLNALFLNELKDVLSAEKQLVAALPKMAKAAESPELATAFTSHLRETEGHVQRLEQIFKLIGETPRAKKCKGMKGLIEEGKEILEEEGEGSVRAYAELLGLDQAVTLLEQTLEEEDAADEKLSTLADGGINAAALAAGQSAEQGAR